MANWCPSYGEGETDPEKAKKLLKYEMAPGKEELLARMLADVSRAAENRKESQLAARQQQVTAPPSSEPAAGDTGPGLPPAPEDAP